MQYRPDAACRHGLTLLATYQMMAVCHYAPSSHRGSLAPTQLPCLIPQHCAFYCTMVRIHTVCLPRDALQRTHAQIRYYNIVLAWDV